MDGELARSVMDKKLDGYGVNNNDFRTDLDIMITITLAEYRELVMAKATASERIRVSENERWERNAENERLKKEIESLQNTIVKLTQVCPMKDGETEE